MEACRWLLAWIGLVICSVVTASAPAPPAGTLRDRQRCAAIARYPGCLIRLLRLNAPRLILIGEEDDWTPAARCPRIEVGAETSHERTLTIYPGACHEFDRRDPAAHVYLGHRLERHPEAAPDAEHRVRGFLIRHLGLRSRCAVAR
jgi:dienelactone hydrolase